MKNLENKKEKQLDLPFKDDSKNETIHGEGEFHKDYLKDFKEDNDDIPVTHLNEEELKKMAEDPELTPEYHALMLKIAEVEDRKHNKKMNEMAEDLKDKEIAERRKELDELYKNDPEHPEEWWKR